MATILKIEIDDKYKQPLIEFLESQIQPALQKVRDSQLAARVAQDEYDDLKKQLYKLKGKSYEQKPLIAENTPLNGYDEGWAWHEKAAYAIAKKGKGLTTGEIADFIISQEPEKDRSKAVASLSAVLTSEKGQKKFKTDKNADNKNIFTVR